MVNSIQSADETSCEMTCACEPMAEPAADVGQQEDCCAPTAAAIAPEEHDCCSPSAAQGAAPSLMVPSDPGAETAATNSPMLSEAMQADLAPPEHESSANAGPADSETSDGSSPDLLIIGTGGGGVAAAIEAAGRGSSVVIVEKGTLGGTCVNIGCVPSKALLSFAKSVAHRRTSSYGGLPDTQPEFDWDAHLEQRRDLIARLRSSKYAKVLAQYPELIRIAQGEAGLTQDGAVLIDGGQRLTPRHVIVATGASPRRLRVEGDDDAPQPLDSTALLALDELPESLIIIGGRATALELGQAMSMLGVQVTLVQRSERIIPDHSPEVSASLAAELERGGMRILTGARPVRVQSHQDGVRLAVLTASGEVELDAAAWMQAVGRVPRTAGLGLEAAGVRLDADGGIIVDRHMASSNPRIHAVGDVTHLRERFVYVAAAAGRVAVRHALGDDASALDISIVPEVIFTDPQVAKVGLTEVEAKSKGYRAQVGLLPREHLPRALVDHDPVGLWKVIVEPMSGRLIGAEVVAPTAGDVIQSAALLIRLGQADRTQAADATEWFFPYLTEAEGLRLAIRSIDTDVHMLSCCA